MSDSWSAAPDQAALTALMRISVKFCRWPWRFW
jgi:hypothetical protein